MLNRYPYNDGHLITAARHHVVSPELLSREERATLADLVALVVEHLRIVCARRHSTSGLISGGWPGLDLLTIRTGMWCRTGKATPTLCR